MSTFLILSKQFALHSRLFNNVLEGVTELKGHERLSGEVNHLQWIAGHLVNTRYNFATMLGLSDSFPYKDLFTDPTKPPPNNRVIDDSLAYPSIHETLKYWNAYAGKFAEAIASIPVEQEQMELPFGNPLGDKTMPGFLAFLASHESYHIGQMSLIRKYLGLGAMSYQ